MAAICCLICSFHTIYVYKSRYEHKQMLSDRNISMCAKCQPSGMNSLSLYRICGQKQRDLEHKTVRDRE